MFEERMRHRMHAHGFRRGPFGRFGGDFGNGGRKRHRRGDIKYILLEMIAEKPQHGYELIKTLEQRYGGFYRPSPGTVYPTLQLLEEEGSVTSETVDGKKIYTITEMGRKQLDERDHDEDEWAGRRKRFFAEGKPKFVELSQSAMALFETVMQAARFGTPEQVKEVQDLLARTTQEVHTIMSKKDTTTL